MEIVDTNLPGVMILTPRVFADARGWFLEAFNDRTFTEHTGVTLPFVQDNHSRSVARVLRGLHYQLPPMEQGKLVRAARGVIFDVAVDIRSSSPAFGMWFGVELSDENQRQLWIPPGFAHGFVTLSAEADLLYKTTGYYSQERDRAIRWDDPEIGIEWPDLGGPPILSDKDRDAPSLRDAEVFQ